MFTAYLQWWDRHPWMLVPLIFAAIAIAAILGMRDKRR